MKKTIMGVAALLLLAGSANAATVGYAKDRINRTNTFKVGTSTSQGQAICLSHAKLQTLKGHTIDFVEYAVGSDKTTDGSIHAFITTSLGGTPLAEGTVEVSKKYAKLKWTLDKPYTITGDEDCLYIGYTAEVPNIYKLLMGDGSYDIKGCNFALSDGEWQDTYGKGFGSALIYINVDGTPEYTDAIFAKSNLDGYLKAGEAHDFTARFVNAGTTAITSFDAVVSVDGKESTQHYQGLDIKPNDGYSFTVNGASSDTEGTKEVSIRIANVNGGDNDIDPSDNSYAASLFFYPSNMERSLLVEGFTSQTCTACPDGHVSITNAIASSGKDVVEVSHHSGYYPDRFTMAEDDAYEFFYGNPTSTYAPAVMVNRTPDVSLSSFPVIETDYNAILRLIDNAENKKPYVSLDLHTEYDAASRQLKVALGVKPHTDMPEGDVRVNVFLVQDSLSGSQLGAGGQYRHNRVFRGTVTDGAWGETLAGQLTPGEVTTWEKTMTLPERIHSSHWTDDLRETKIDEKTGKETYWYGKGTYSEDNVNVAPVPENMTVVAFVAQYDADSNTKNAVYNCTEARLGSSHTQAGYGPSTGVECIGQNTQATGIYVSGGRVIVDGACDSIAVYNLAGARVDAGSVLDKGVYVVKVVAGGNVTTKKVLVK